MSKAEAVAGGEETKVQAAFGSSPPKPHVHPKLRWTDSSGGHEVTLRERTTVGSAPGAGLVIADPMVSRLHAELEPRPDGTWVRDLGSRNGTFVDGIRVSGACIPDGGQVRFGSIEVALEYAIADSPQDLWPTNSFGPLLGASASMRRLFAYLARISPSDSPVLIQGETGTGKELVANAIHEASPRAAKPFVIVDCAALPETLIESELFGHMKGAFTGALQMRVGAIEAADGGTVFLDEIGELPTALQPHLLRVLETGMIRRVGETTRRKVNVRFISATHRDIGTMVNVGAFREDLYFRLAVLPVEVPPLRDRQEDISLLVQAFVPAGTTASPEVFRELQKRPWLGNVRELRNFVHRAAALGTHQALRMGPAVPQQNAAAGAPSSHARGRGLGVESVSFGSDYKSFRDDWMRVGEREYLVRLLERNGGNVSAAAREAGVDRTYIHRLMRNHSL